MTHSQTGLPNIFPELYGPYDFPKLKNSKVHGMSQRYVTSFSYRFYMFGASAITIRKKLVILVIDISENPIF